MSRTTCNTQTSSNHSTNEAHSQAQYTNCLDPLITHTKTHNTYDLDKTQSSAVSMAVAAAAAAYGNLPHSGENTIGTQKLITYHPPVNTNNHANYSTPLPSPPAFHHLEDIADSLVSAQVRRNIRLLLTTILGTILGLYLTNHPSLLFCLDHYAKRASGCILGKSRLCISTRIVFPIPHCRSQR